MLAMPRGIREEICAQVTSHHLSAVLVQIEQTGSAKGALGWRYNATPDTMLLFSLNGKVYKQLLEGLVEAEELPRRSKDWWQFWVKDRVGGELRLEAERQLLHRMITYERAHDIAVSLRRSLDHSQKSSKDELRFHGKLVEAMADSAMTALEWARVVNAEREGGFWEQPALRNLERAFADFDMWVNITRYKNRVSRIALRKMRTLVTDSAEARRYYECCPEEKKGSAILLMERMAVTFRDFSLVYYWSCNQGLSDSVSRRALMKMDEIDTPFAEWLSMSAVSVDHRKRGLSELVKRKLMDKACTFSEWWSVLFKVPANGADAILVYENLERLASTFDELCMFFRVNPTPGAEFLERIGRRIEVLDAKFSQWKGLFDRVHMIDKRLASVALEKMAGIADCLPCWESVWKRAPVGSPQRERAFAEMQKEVRQMATHRVA